MIPFRKIVKSARKGQNYREKLVIYEESNFSTARKQTQRFMQANFFFNPKQRSEFLGEMLYNDIINFLNEDNIVVENLKYVYTKN